MSEKPMTLNEAQKHAHRMVREKMAVKFMADVIDATVWADDTRKTAELAVKNARKQVQVIKDLQDKLEGENMALATAQRDMKRRGQALSEKIVTYEKSVETRMAELDDRYEREAEENDAQIALLETSKETLLGEVSALRAEKASIEGVIEAFRKANAGGDT